MHAMLALARALRLHVIAEGVEDEPTLAKLRDLGCDAAQGYLFTRPVGVGRISEMIAASPQWNSDVSTIPA